MTDFGVGCAAGRAVNSSAAKLWRSKAGNRSADFLQTFQITKGINGAQGRNRTTDTRIFNPLLYP